jgi:acyl transferase domain-containing protein/NADPH:quinone reductase-like Zn-dependent oxidoreductase/NADP-dependent 3-hydroxy acid dehydrogenase YdfG/acyl carrier protein
MNNISKKVDKDKLEQLNSSQRILLALDEAVKKLKDVERAKTEAIAIVGLSCRFPGGVTNPEEFWQLLIDGVDAITEIPSQRWHLEDYYHPNPDTPGKMYSRYGGFLQQVDQFDAQFFGISPREAIKLDPQQRLLLEVTWEALENAGIIPQEQVNGQTGVFIGITTNDYARLITPGGDLSQIDPYYLTGNPLNAVAGRLSYTLGLHGPCMAVDTACSSSLVAVHLACQSLRNQECNRALAGGVNLILSPENNIGLSKAKVLSADGRCKTFDSEADGITRGEGCGVLVLKRLSDAVADGDRILALIRGSAVNQDGASSGFTVPNRNAQENLIRQTLTRANVKPEEVDYVEAHGTGTSLGDPIEVRALAAVLGAGRTAENPLKIGAVKTNIGHLESAAGIAGMIKVILSLQHQQIPPHLHLKQLNTHINWDELPVSVTTQATPWPMGNKQRLAGVSSFGASGTNAHVILAEAPTNNSLSKPQNAKFIERPQHLLNLSAKTEKALRELVQRYINYLQSNPEKSLADICFTANTGRSHWKYRLGILADSTMSALAQLTTWALGQDVPGVVLGEAESTSKKIAFLFTGQGSQYTGMGQKLYQTQAKFRQIIEQCDQILQPYLDKPLLEVLYPQPGTNSPIDNTAYTQVALFALEYALYQLWQSWGIKPDVVMGHSVGEYVAACVAGVFSLEDGLKLIAARGRLMQALPENGAMVAVMATAEQLQPLLAAYKEKVAIAAVNGPQSLVISGEKSAISAITSQLETAGIKTKQLQVSHAFHSPLMQPMLADFLQVANEIKFAPPQMKLISNVTGQLATIEIATAEYWCRHILNPVEFAASMATLQQQKVAICVEIGPKPILLGMGRQCNLAVEGLWLPSLRSGQDDWQVMLLSLAQLHCHGVAVDWLLFDADYSRVRLHLPTYPFQRQRFWIETVDVQQDRAALISRNGKGRKIIHPLLGQRLPLATSQSIHFESQISAASPTFLQDHCIYDATILPATAYIEMALSAGAIVFKTDRVQLETVSIQQALVFSGDEPKTLQVVLTPENTTVYSWQVLSYLEDESNVDNWILHASGKLGLGNAETHSAPVDLAGLLSEDSTEISVKEYYQSLHERGFDYGEQFQAIARLWQGENQAVGSVRLPLPLTADASKYLLHPVLLDACFQILGTNFPDNGQQDVYLPVGVEQLQVYQRAGSSLWSRVEKIAFQDVKQQHLQADLSLVNDAGELVAEITGLSFRRITQKAFQRVLAKVLPAPQTTDNWLYQIAWQRQNLEPASSNKQPSSWLIFADQGGLGQKLAQLLTAAGDRCIMVSAGAVYQQLQADRYQINLAHPEDFGRLIQDNPCQGIVHLWSCDATTEPQLVSCGSVLFLLQAIYNAKLPVLPSLYLVTKGTQTVGGQLTPLQVQSATLWGLGRVIALEHPELHCVRLDINPDAPEDHIPSVAQELLVQSREDQIAYRQGLRYVARLVRSDAAREASVTSQAFQLQISEYGVFENLTLAAMQRRQPGPGEVEIAVRAVGLNFRDVLNALGMLREYTEQMGITDAKELPFGGECSGIVVAVGENVSHLQVGDAVIAAQTIGSFASFVIVRSEFVVRKPENLTFEEAATIPTAFLTAYYGLYQQAQLKSGERILIHAAAGGVGQAAVQLAQRVGAEVLATASPSKWEHLRATGVKQVMNSRSLEFADQIREITSGQGIDVVLNSLNGEYIPKSLEVLSDRGRFIEIGKIGIWDAQQVKHSRPYVSYIPFDLLDISLENPSLIGEMLGELMAEFQQGSLKPLPLSVFSIQDVANAFRYMAQSKHIGKVVVSIPQPQMPKETTIQADSSYLITGGLGALGLQVAQWLVEQGAQNLVLMGRRGVSPEIQPAIEQLEQAGARVLVVTADVSQQEDVSQMLATSNASMPPLRGIIHAAGLLADGMLLRQTWENFELVMAPKVAGAWNLHILTKELDLDFFVCFSSVSALLGSPGQGNYAAANAFMDALAHHRQALGLPGSSINWGPWADAGMAAALSSREQARWAAQGVQPIPLEPGLQILAKVVQQNLAQVGVVPIDWSKFTAQFPSDIELPFLAEFTNTIESKITPQVAELRQQLEASAPKQRPILLMNYVRSQIAKVLNLTSTEEIDPKEGFLQLGMDSLMAVELRNRLQSSLGCSVPASLIFDYPTVDALVSYLIQELWTDRPPEPSTENSPPPAQGIAESELEELSDSEAEALLLSKLDNLKY